MADDASRIDNPGIPQIRYGPIRWLNSAAREAIEKAVSEYSSRFWKIRSERDFSEFACHHAAIVSDGSLAVFFKHSTVADAKQQFERELSGLLALSEKTGVLIPESIAIVAAEGGTLLIMKALEAVDRGPRQWRQIGTTLARIHRVKGNCFGFETDGYWGPLPQDNRPMSDWMTFYRERRLVPLLKSAVDSGSLPSSMVAAVEKLITRLPELCGPEVTPTLLHGDAQQNNFISTSEGTYVVDPAIYYGNPEMDLALLDGFQPVPDAVYDGYRDELPIDTAFFARRDLWRMPLYLAAVALEGPMHLSRLTKVLNRFL